LAQPWQVSLLLQLGVTLHSLHPHLPSAAQTSVLVIAMQAVGLPVCLSDLNLSHEETSKLDIVVSACLTKPNLCLNMPMALTHELLMGAILKTDTEGRKHKSQHPHHTHMSV
jgi:glycerol dehydrogenase-like iron-containing ADH family enzyme